MKIAAETIRPVGDKILVRPVKMEEKTTSGLFIPNNAKVEMLIGDVIAVGNGRVSASGALLPMEVSSGDRIVYNRYAGSGVKTGEDETVLLMCVDDVLAVVKEQP